MTPEEYEEFQRAMAAGTTFADVDAPPVYRQPRDVPSDVDLLALRAERLDQATLAGEEAYPYQVSPTSPISAQDRALAGLEARDAASEQVAVKARAGSVQSPVEADLFLSRYAGQGQVFGDDGELRPIDLTSPSEVLRSLYGRRLLQRPLDAAQAVQRVRLGEVSAEEAGLPEGSSLDISAPDSGSGIYENYYMPPMKALNLPEVAASEAVFGAFPTADAVSAGLMLATGGRAGAYLDMEKMRETFPDKELLYYSVDEEGNPRKPGDPAYFIGSKINPLINSMDTATESFEKKYPEATGALSKFTEMVGDYGENYLEDVLSVPYLSYRGIGAALEAAGFEDNPYSKIGEELPRFFARTMRDPLASMPRPFTATERYLPTGEAIGAALDHPSFMVRVIDGTAKSRGAGDEFYANPSFREEREAIYGEDLMGVHPAYASGMLAATLLPTGPGARVAGGVARLAAGKAISLPVDLLNNSSLVQGLASRAAAMKVLGQSVDAADAPSIRGIAASRAVNPVATALEMQAVAMEALGSGNRTINADYLAARFGGNSQAARILDQAAKATPGSSGIVSEIDARALGSVSRSYVMAGDAARLLKDLPGLTEEQARKLVTGISAPADRTLITTMTMSEMEQHLKQMLKTAGAAPNTKTPFLNSMYAMAARVQDDIIKGLPVGDVVSRAVKGMGGKRALFQKNLLRALVEEGRRAGKDVDALISRTAQGKPSTNKLKTMANALGDGRGGWAVARAFRDTMNQSAKDALMQALPEDYKFLSRTMMVSEDKYKQAHKVLMDTMDSLYGIAGTRSSGSVVTPRAGVELSELVARVVQEVGPGILGQGAGYKVAKGMLRKLRAGGVMTSDELDMFTMAVQESLARDVAGVVQAVSEGAQTALAQGGMATRNMAYIDAATGLGLGRASRAKHSALLALKGQAQTLVEAGKGSSAASILVADPSNFSGSRLAKAAEWVDKRYLKEVGYRYDPATSVITEDYARRAQAAVATAGDRVTDRLAEIAGPGKKPGGAAFTQVVKEMNEEVDTVNRTRFRDSMERSISEFVTISDEAVVAEAERTARFMLSSVNLVAKDAPFRRGEAVIEAALKLNGFDGGLEELRKLPAEEAVTQLEEAVSLSLHIQHNGESWINLVKTIVPGIQTQEMLLTGAGITPAADEVIGSVPALRSLIGKRERAITLSVAVKAVTNHSGQLDSAGQLIPNLENLKKVMEVLEAANGENVYKHSLQYNDFLSMLPGQGLKERAQDAWVVGTYSWLTHQRAALDSAKVMRQLFDSNPELVLDLMPGTASAAKGLQRVAIQSVANDMMKLEESFTGKAANRDEYNRAINNAYDRLNGLDQAGRPTDLDITMYNLARYVETMDFSLTAENRVSLATSLFKAAQGSGGRVPDVGSLVNATAEEVLDSIPKTLDTLSPSAQKDLKRHVTEMMARYEVSGPFEKHLNKGIPVGGEPVVQGKTQAAMVNSMVNGVVLGADTSLIAPTYRALESMWERAGVRLGSGQFAPGIDSTVLISNARPMVGNVYSMVQAGGASSAVSRLEAAIASGRLQSSLDALSLRALKDTGEATRTQMITGSAISQVVQSVSRVMNSTLLAGGGVPGLSFAPHPIYHFRNMASVPEILIATIGAENAVKVAKALPVGAASAQRRASSVVFRSKIAKAILPAADESEVVIKSPLYGNITAKELDELMDVANIKFSRASIEAYETIGQQMAQAAKTNLRTTLLSKSGDPARMGTQFLRAFDPRGMNEWMRVAEDTDNITRRATFAAALIDGRSIEDAALLARESLLDYGKVSATAGGFEQGLQRYLLFWAFRRQSLFATMNALTDGSDGVFSRADLMGRWIRLKQDQKKGVSPEEYLFGEPYKLWRGMDEDVDEFGFNMGMPSVVGEGLGDFILWSSIGLEVGSDLVEGDMGEAFRDGTYLIAEALEQENLQPVITFLSELVGESGRMDDRGGLVPDVLVGQAMAFQNMTGIKSFDMSAKMFNWVPEKDEEGVDVVTPGRPTLQRESGRPYQMRFATKADERNYKLVRLFQTASGMARTYDEYFRIAMTIEPFIPEGYEARYRAQVSTMAYIMGFETPSRKTDVVEERAKLKREMKRKLERAPK